MKGCVPACLLAFFFSCQVPAAEKLLLPLTVGGQRPAIAIIIDDMGNSLAPGVQAVNLPAELTYSILPYTPFSRRLARLAHRLGKEVMLHLPMEALDHRPIGLGGLRPQMTRRRFVRTILDDLAAIPYVSGINNHMGSLLTQDVAAMRWLMAEIARRRSLYFIDSYTSRESIAQRVAIEHRIPSLRRNVFLDNDRNPRAIGFYYRRLLNLARQQGVALAIGHPHAETLAFLARHLPQLREEGIELLPVSALIKRARRYEEWRRMPLLASHALEVEVTKADN